VALLLSTTIITSMAWPSPACSQLGQGQVLDWSRQLGLIRQLGILVELLGLRHLEDLSEKGRSLPQITMVKNISADFTRQSLLHYPEAFSLS
jgi:hypothetical protein